MGSSSTRAQLVSAALTIAGRDVSITTLVNGMLNRMMRDWALQYKYPLLRKTGSAQSLAAGASTSALPSDFGAGMESLLFGDERLPIYEKSSADFVYNNGFKPSSSGTGRPYFYMVDEQGGNFVFNVTADVLYSFVPVYFRVPADLATDTSGDSSSVWMKNDELVVQGLVHKIFQYMGDEREEIQKQRVDQIMAEFRRGSTPVGGGSPKIQLSRAIFRRRRF